MSIDIHLYQVYNDSIKRGQRYEMADRKGGKKDMCTTKKQLDTVVEDYRSMKALADEMNEQVKALEREIISYLDSNQLLSETGDNYTVKISTCERRTLDSKRLEADLGSLSEYQRVTQYRRLYVG